MDCTQSWVNQRRAKALTKASGNCSEVANNFLITNTQEISSSVAKSHVPEPAPATVIFQVPTTSVDNPLTHVPPVPATTKTSDLLFPFQSVTYTLVSTLNKGNLDTSVSASVAPCSCQKLSLKESRLPYDK